MTPEEFGLVQAAQDYDLAHRPALGSWTRVPDDQVLRLLTGVKLYRRSNASRPCTVVDQARWAVEWIKERYGPGSAYDREHGQPE
jgi:hypothetical protein